VRLVDLNICQNLIVYCTELQQQILRFCGFVTLAVCQLLISLLVYRQVKLLQFTEYNAEVELYSDVSVSLCALP